MPAPEPLPSSLTLLAKVSIARFLRATGAAVLARCSCRLLASECRWILRCHHRSRRSRWSWYFGRRNTGGNMLWNLYLLFFAINSKMKLLQRVFLEMVAADFQPDLTTFNVYTMAFSIRHKS
jgi:hypothetical protein